jgi:NTE family protein
VAPRNRVDDETFVVLCFSGGGMRAAALSFGVLKELQETPMHSPDGPSLLDQVDVISSVSGGSFTSAYFVALRDTFFQNFQNAVLAKNWKWRVLLSCLNPRHLLRLLSPRFSRTDVAAAVYSRQIFKDYTFDSLPKARPFLIINATDTTRGARFEFTQSQFDPMCRDVGKLKLGKAVAASAAFPGLFPPLVIESKPGACGYQLPPQIAIAADNRALEARIHQYAKGVASYALKKERRYIHLLDGGVADNIGARGLIEALSLNASPWSLVSRLPRADGSGIIKRVVIILVNAKTAPDLRPDERARSQSLLRVVPGVAFSTMANYSFETVTYLREIVNAKAALGYTTNDIYVIEVGMEGIANDADYDFFSTVPTRLYLPPNEVNRIVTIGRAALRDDKEFQRLKRDLAKAGNN